MKVCNTKEKPKVKFDAEIIYEMNVKDVLDKTWDQAPAYIIDWIRDNSDDIKKYVKDLNEAIDKFVEAINY